MVEFLLVIEWWELWLVVSVYAYSVYLQVEDFGVRTSVFGTFDVLYKYILFFIQVLSYEDMVAVCGPHLLPHVNMIRSCTKTMWKDSIKLWIRALTEGSWYRKRWLYLL